MANIDEQRSKIRPPTMVEALVPVGALVIMLVSAVYLYGGDATAGPFQVALILATLVAGLTARRIGHSYESVGKAAIDGVSTAMGAIFILLSVGALIGTWSMSGTVATLTYYGIQFLSPTWFYVASVVICAIIALSIGSAWTVVGTLGVGLIGIATAIGVDPVITAGAIISGAYFGDKISPLSETTNLAPAVAGTDLITHIKSMMSTTIPSILIALALYAFIGLREEVVVPIDLTVVLEVMESIFNISLWTLLPLAVVMILAFRRFPASAAILVGALLGGLVAIIFQPHVVSDFVNDPSLSTPWVMIKGVWTAMATGFVIDTGYPGLDDLFSRGGMESMLGTVWLILGAMAFGGIMEYTGMLARLIHPLVQRAKSDRSILIATGLTAIGVNLIAADQYLAIVLTAKSFKKEYEERGIAPQTLSRQVEDTATVTSPLIPWNSCGAYMSATLGIATMAYLPFAFFNLINPIISFIYALIGFQIKHVKPGEEFGEAPEEVRFHGVGRQRADTMAHEDAHPEVIGPGNM